MTGSGFAHDIAGGGGGLIIPSLHSPDYVPGVSGWAIFKNGNVEFNSGTFRGTITGGAFQGTDFQINTSGAFFYTGTPALGNLFASIASAAGTDQYGNVYGTGITVGESGNTQVQLYNNGGQGTMGINIPGFTNGAFYGGIQGTYAYFVERGPANLTAGFTDFVEAVFYSSDGVSSSANWEMYYVDPTGTAHVTAISNFNGFEILAGSVTGVKPGTGGSQANPAQAESWHTLPLASGWTSVNGPFYRATADGKVEIFGSATHAAFTGSTNLSATGALAATGYAPARSWNVGGAGIPGRAGAEVTAAGTVVAVPNGTSCTECDPSGAYPLNL